MSSPRSLQLNLPPMPVEALNPKRFSSSTAPLRTPNLLKVTRTALDKCDLKKRWLAALFGCSEQLIGAQLSDDQPEKHLSMRKMGRIDDAGFWREFLYLLAEDLGPEVVIVTPEQREAQTQLTAAAANYVRALSR
jgi:hypothetical protein